MENYGNLSNSSIIVVSNRLPFVIEKDINGTWVRKSSAGGLVTAVAPVVNESNGLWIGWPGMSYQPGIDIPESDPDDVSPTAGLRPDQIIPINLLQEDFDLYYNGCCNATFWPLFHSMPDKALFIQKYWETYQKVNKMFADATLNALRRMLNENSSNFKEINESNIPLIWIHDFHLMLAANTIRKVAEEENMPCKIGFFLHIPFPPWDIMKIFPWEDLILLGLLGCDLIGFHIEDYCVNFLDSCNRGLGSRIDRSKMLVEHGGRTVRVKTLPIGIPFEKFERMALNAKPHKLFTDYKVILGVDRLDYTKALPRRLEAFERLLEDHPEYIEKVVILQVAVPSRTDVKEYQDLKEEMDKLVGQINGKFSTPSWSPIRYIHGCVSQLELAGYYRYSDIALVTPFRDGMNLVAKEFVASRIDEPGVLILSPFAGASETMAEALRGNPYEIGKLADSIYRALNMPTEERQARMVSLRNREKIQNVDFWLKSFLKNVGSCLEEDGENVATTTMNPLTMDDFENYMSSYVGDAPILCLLLDYDGTLAPIAPHPDLAKIPTETKSILERLSHRPDVFIAIISGRSLENVMQMVGIPGITYAGNHGLEIRHSDGSQFLHALSEDDKGKTQSLLQCLENQVCEDGAWVENKGVLLTYHYREVTNEKRPKLIEKASKLITEHGFKVGHAHCALECKPQVKWDKGRASINILRTAFGVDWSNRIRIIFAGDDVTDEDAIIALKGMAFTFRIITDLFTTTAADKRLPSCDSIVTLLRWIEKHMSNRAIKSSSSNHSLNSSSTTSMVHIPNPKS